MGPPAETAADNVGAAATDPASIKAEPSDDDYETAQNEAGVPQRRRQRKPSKALQPDDPASPAAKKQCIKPDAGEPAAAATKPKPEAEGGNSYGLRRRSAQQAGGEAATATDTAASAGSKEHGAGEQQPQQQEQPGAETADGAAAVAPGCQRPPVTITDVRGLLISHCGRSVSESTMPVIKMLSRVADGSVDLKLLFSRETLARLLHQMNDPSGSSYNLKPMSKYTYMSALVRVLDLPSVQRLFCSEADQQQLQVLRGHIAEAKQEFMRQAEGSRKPKARAPAAAASSGGKRKQQQQQSSEPEVSPKPQQLRNQLQQQQEQLRQQQAERAAAVAAANAAVTSALQELDPLAAAAMAPVSAASPPRVVAAAAVAATPGSTAGADAATSSDATAALANVDGTAAGTASDDGSRLRRSRRQQRQLAEADLLLIQQLQQLDQQEHQQQGQQEEEEEQEQEESLPAPATLRTLEDLKQLLTSIKGADKVAQQSVATLLSPIKTWSAACGGCSDLRTLFLGGAVSGVSARSSSRAKAGFDGMLQLLQARVARDELSPATAAMHMYSLLSVLQLPAVQEQLFPSQAEWQQLRARVSTAKKDFVAMDKALKAAAAAAEDQYVPWQPSKKRKKARSTAATNSSSSHLAAVAAAASEQQQRQEWDWYAAAAAAAAAAPAASADDSSDEEAAAVLASLGAAGASQQGEEMELGRAVGRAGFAPLMLQELGVSRRAGVHGRPGLYEQQPQQQAGGGGPSSPAEADSVKSSWLADSSRLHPHLLQLQQHGSLAATAGDAAAMNVDAAAEAGSGSVDDARLLNEAESMLMQLLCQLQPDKGLRCAALQRLDAAMLLLRGLAAEAAAAASEDAGGAVAAACDEQPTAAAATTAALLSFKTDYMRVVIWRDNGMAASSVLGAVDRLMDNISAKAAGAMGGAMALKAEC